MLNIILLFTIKGFAFPKGYHNLDDDRNQQVNDVQSSSNPISSNLTTLNPDVQSVLLYLKSIQDNFSTDKWLVPAMEDNSGQTFNNALTAMAFILTMEKERAERILDFYAKRADTSNKILNKQSFFYNGEARGFYQNVSLGGGSYSPFICDRWMGDNAWLLLAYKFYESKYGFSGKPLYVDVSQYLKDLLLAFYIDDPGGHGGFVRHGWRWGPRDSSITRNDYKLHETDLQGNPVGHEEGNIDTYAVLKICGETEKARKIKEWVDFRMSELEKIPNVSLPLDLYSWRSLAFSSQGEYYKNLVLVPENDSRFKKEVEFNGKKAIGFYSSAVSNIQNVWMDGLGHMVCAFYASGYKAKGDFYSSQLDSFLINRTIKGISSYALPYTANTTGGYDWVDIKKGFSSACAWYIFAKNAFNPFTFDTNTTGNIEQGDNNKLLYDLKQNYPNPFNPSTKIRYTLAPTAMQAGLPAPNTYSENINHGEAYVKLNVFDSLGNDVFTLVNESQSAGNYEVEFNGKNFASGVYYYTLQTDEFKATNKMLLIK
ncbi:MAG: T9SS type A sorting domain-containing protein [Ignavibacteriales bacterium]|nr:T9SS type A sorting domain-containing protein [Ignavibacteriales bacterium]